MPKQILFNSEAREKLLKGVDTLANAVKVTLGARGKNVVIAELNREPFITKDGVTVAKSIFLQDPLEHIGAQIVKTVAERTAKDAGDGTTTSTVLAQAIAREGSKLVQAEFNPMLLKKGMDYAVEQIVAKLREMSITINDDLDNIDQIATISANNDAVVGKLVSDAFKAVGKTGIVNIENSPNSEDSIKVTQGISFAKGYIAQEFITDTIRKQAVLENPYILIYEGKISSINSCIRILEAISKTGESCLIICETLDEEANLLLRENVARRLIKACVVKAPEHGERRVQILEDIAAATGATIAHEKRGLSLEDMTLAHLGRAKKAVVTANDTIIIDGLGDKSGVESLVNSLKVVLAEQSDDFEIAFISKRISQLTGGIATILVGARSEFELYEKKDRIDDAVRATKSAIEEGVLAGGGTALIRASKNIVKTGDLTVDAGIGIILKAVEAPLIQMCENASIKPHKVLQEVQEAKGNYGFNLKTEQIEDLFASGIVDPTKVVRVALENANSVSSMILTSECLIAEKINLPS